MRVRPSVEGRAHHFGTLYLRLAIFYDNYLLIKFGNNFTELTQFVSSTVYTSQLFFNRDSIRAFANIKFIVVMFGQYGKDINMNDHNIGNNKKLLRDFCKFQHILNRNASNKWSAALLLTGYEFSKRYTNFDTKRFKQPFISGLIYGVTKRRDRTGI